MKCSEHNYCDLVTFTEEILNEKLHFPCSVRFKENFLFRRSFLHLYLRNGEHKKWKGSKVFFSFSPLTAATQKLFC